MFYPCTVDIPPAGSRKQGVVPLTPAESRWLIARATAALPEARAAVVTDRIDIMSGGTTSLALHELTGEKTDLHRVCMGMSAEDLLTTSREEG